jgi:hypothetical protein
MPLLDHFHPPLSEGVGWGPIHSGWATHVTETLNETWLSADFLALEHTSFGPHVEIDVAALEHRAGRETVAGNGGGVATLPRTWAPPQAVCTVATLFPDAFEVRVYAGHGGWYLVGAIEFVSPGNKDRPDERQAFAAKCASYLHQGASVVVIDVVTNRRANLHNDILRMVSVTDERAFLPDGVFLYAAAYRPALRQGQPQCDVWHQPCAIGQPLPTMPLRLTGDLFVPIDFETTYMETCRRRRLVGPAPGTPA